MRKKRHSGLTFDRRTQVMGAIALGGVFGAGAVELGRVWRRGSAPLPTEADDLLEAASTATLETIAVVREGYRATSNRENAVFNLLVSFTATFGITRASTALIRSGKGYGVFRNLTIADRRDRDPRDRPRARRRRPDLHARTGRSHGRHGHVHRLRRLRLAIDGESVAYVAGWREHGALDAVNQFAAPIDDHARRIETAIRPSARTRNATD